MDRFAGDAVKDTKEGAQAALATQAAQAEATPATKKRKGWWDDPFEGTYDGPIQNYNFKKTGGKYFDSKDRRKLERRGYTDTEINEYVGAIKGKYVRGYQKLKSGADSHLPTITELNGFDPYQFDNNKQQVRGKGTKRIHGSAMDFLLNYKDEYGKHKFNAQQIRDWSDENNFKWQKSGRKKMKQAIRDYVPAQDPAPTPDPAPPAPPPVTPPKEVKPPDPVAPPAQSVSDTPTAGDSSTPLTQAEWNLKYLTQPDVRNQEDVVVNSPSQNFGTARTAYRAANDAMYGFEGLNYSNIWQKANPTQNWNPTTRKQQAQENVYQMQAESTIARNRVFGDIDNYKPPLFTAFPVNTKKPRMPNLTPPESVTTPQTFGGL